MTATTRPSADRRTSGLVLAGFIGAVLVVAVIGALAATSSAEIYERLNRPPWAPPTWLFGPVWTVLYGMIAVSGWLLWRSVGSVRAARTELTVYAVGLVLNALWAPLFFAAEAYGAALADIVLLDVTVLVTMAMFAERARRTAWLLAPYLAWIIYATALNAALIVLN